ncbi:MAG: aminotransferase class IV [Anaerolineales bacterium]|nr:aminotransferase class IV [Anaerolineales bacterium]
MSLPQTRRWRQAILGWSAGYGVFEVLRTYGVQPFRLREHLERLHRSAAQIDLEMPWGIGELERIVQATLAQNDAGNVTIRIIVTGGESANGLLPEGKASLLVMTAPVRVISAETYHNGASLISVELQRFMPTVKSLNYVTAIMGQQRAKRAGAIEALYRAADGTVDECTTSNVFVFRGDELVTADAGILPGITRGFALEIAADLHPIRYRSICYDELREVDEMFITSTTKEILPIVRVDDIVIGSGHPGLRTQRLLATFRAGVQAKKFRTR